MLRSIVGFFKGVIPVQEKDTLHILRGRLFLKKKKSPNLRYLALVIAVFAKCCKRAETIHRKQVLQGSTSDRRRVKETP